MKKSPALTFTFMNPNSPALFEEALRKILLEKLLTAFSDAEHLQSVG